jgi:chitodextrinase
VYNDGDLVGYDGNLYQAQYYTQGQTPGDANGPWEEIQLTEDGTAVWTASRIFNGGDIAVDDGVTYKALYYTRDQTPGDPNGPWEEIAPAGPNGTAPWTPTTVYEAGDEVSYDGHAYEAQYYTRDQTPGAADGPWKPIS